jgi:hypothetical protein
MAITGNTKIAGFACDDAGNPTNLTDMAGRTTKDTKSAGHRLASSRSSSSSSSSVGLANRCACDAAGRDAPANG